MLIKALGPCIAVKLVFCGEMRSGASSTVSLMSLEIHFQHAFHDENLSKDLYWEMQAFSCALLASKELKGHFTVSSVPRPRRSPKQESAAALTVSAAESQSLHLPLARKNPAWETAPPSLITGTGIRFLFGFSCIVFEELDSWLLATNLLISPDIVGAEVCWSLDRGRKTGIGCAFPHHKVSCGPGQCQDV